MVFTLFNNEKIENKPLTLSVEAAAVLDAGRELWTYYHSQTLPSFGGVGGGINVNASFYDIREHFQGRSEKGIMKSKSTDENYTALIGELRNRLNILAQKITPKI